ncbi:MAG: hypothetical protein ACREA0_05160, partial [bacterium]
MEQIHALSLRPIPYKGQGAGPLLHQHLLGEIRHLGKLPHPVQLEAPMRIAIQAVVGRQDLALPPPVIAMQDRCHP